MIKNFFNKIVGKKQSGNNIMLSDSAGQTTPKLPDVKPDHFGSGLKDAYMDGWYDSANGILYTGFPVNAEDVVVDIGCGDGGAALFCANRGAHVICADISADKVASTLERLSSTPARKVEGVVSDANPLLIADAVASKVICMEVIEHVEDPAHFLSELVRIGKPGAHYLLTVPDPVAEHMQKGVAAEVYFQHPNHIRIIERAEFEKMVTDAGLVIESHTYYGFYWALWFMFFWISKVDLTNPDHPLLTHWTRTWEALMSNPETRQLRTNLNQLMPKSQAIIARKPVTKYA